MFITSSARSACLKSDYYFAVKRDAGTDRINGTQCLLVLHHRSVIKSFTLTTAQNIIQATGDVVPS